MMVLAKLRSDGRGSLPLVATARLLRQMSVATVLIGGCTGPSREVLEEDPSWATAGEFANQEDADEPAGFLRMEMSGAYRMAGADPVEDAVVLDRGRVALWSNTAGVLRVADIGTETTLRYPLRGDDVVGVRDRPGGQVQVITERGEMRTLGRIWRRGERVAIEGTLLAAVGSGAGWIAIQARQDEGEVLPVSIVEGVVSPLGGPLPGGGRESLGGVAVPRWVIAPAPEGALIGHATVPHHVWRIGSDGHVRHLLGSYPSGRLTLMQRTVTAVDAHYMRVMLELPSNEGVLALYGDDGAVLEEVRIEWPMSVIGYEPGERVLYGLLDVGDQYELLVYDVSAVAR